MGDALIAPPRSTVGLGAERKEKRVGDRERLPYLYKAIRARNERIGVSGSSATSPCFLFRCSSSTPRLSPFWDQQGQQTFGRHLIARDYRSHIAEGKTNSEKSLALGNLAGKRQS